MKSHGSFARLFALSIAVLGPTTVDARPVKRHAAPAEGAFVNLPSLPPDMSRPPAVTEYPDLAKNAEAAIRLTEALDVSPGLQ